MGKVALAARYQAHLALRDFRRPSLLAEGGSLVAGEAADGSESPRFIGL